MQTPGTEGDTTTQTAAGQADIAQQLNSDPAAIRRACGNHRTGTLHLFRRQRPDGSLHLPPPRRRIRSARIKGSATTRAWPSSPDGTTFPVVLTAQQNFSIRAIRTSANVFGAIENLSTALQNNDTAGVQTAVSGLSQVAVYLEQPTGVLRRYPGQGRERHRSGQQSPDPAPNPSQQSRGCRREQRHPQYDAGADRPGGRAAVRGSAPTHYVIQFLELS